MTKRQIKLITIILTSIVTALTVLVLTGSNDNIYEFLERYRFSHPEIPFFRFIIETIELFFAIDTIFILIGIVILIKLYKK